MDFKSFKKNKKKFIKQAKKMNMPKNDYNDTRFWTPTKDDAGNGEALFRFLPQKDVEKNPIVLYYQHFFKEKGKYFVEKCPTTWEKDCPICEYVQPFWNGTEAEEKIAMKYGKKKQFVANIYMIKDPAKPENNGKVFLFKFGVKIFNKIMDKVNPSSELDDEVSIYDLWEGMNFKLKIKKVYGYPNYESSEFTGSVVPIAKDDDGIEAIYNKIYALDEFIDMKDCKSDRALIKKFFTITGIELTDTGEVTNENKETTKKTRKESVKASEESEKAEDAGNTDPTMDSEEHSDTENSISESTDEDDESEEWDWDEED